MFTVIYTFHIRPKSVNSFKKSWKELTNLIYKYEGSLGSRLHKQSEFHYVAYAQWPDKTTWLNSGSKLPEKANEIKTIMSNSCLQIETLFELDIVEDLLKS